jgi:signal transduction histidine kinase
VFARLVAIMLALAASLLALVAAFFLLYLSPVLNASIDPVLQEYARVVAATSPSYDAAKSLTARLDVQMRYEGPDGAWTTAASLPTVVEARREHGGSFNGRHYYVTPASNGGAYLFAWTFTQRMQTAHLVIPTLLLVLMAVVIFAAHVVLRRMLQPLRWLGDGVARLSEGHLDVIVPKRSADEFGALTDAFNHMVAQVGDMIRARDRLLLDVSHELRSPLTRLRVALELTGNAETKRRMAPELAEMEIMISELLELERLRDGHGLRTTRQNVMTILDEVARNFQDRPPNVRVTPGTPEILVDVDAERMRTVIRNLLENAIKYSLPDSRVVEISAAPNGERIVIRVTDDGPGVPERDMPSLFEPFFRVDRSRSKKTGGYGLGLSISKRIVEAHGGTIAVENNATRGASFVVTLPKPA